MATIGMNGALPSYMMVSFRSSIAFVLAALAVACSSSSDASSSDVGAQSEAGTDPTQSDPASSNDAAATTDSIIDGATEIDGGLASCPTSGAGAIDVAGVICVTVTPIQTGAASTGENANVPSYALYPSAGSNGKLVLFLNASGGEPSGAIASPTQSFYTAATALGYTVLAVSYYSQKPIGSLCGNQDDCYLPTREAVITGVAPAGASPTVSADITVDQSITGRAELALNWLGVNDSAHPWRSFLKAGDGGSASHIDWTKVIVAGHSQGGGHAAAIGKLYPVERVIQLSSVCDSVNDTPASWTNGTTGTWASDPTQFYGLAAPTIFTGGKATGGDTICPQHVADWMNLGMVAAHQQDDAATCGNTGVTHSESVSCTANYAAWQALLQ
jgi:hypothetical protein